MKMTPQPQLHDGDSPRRSSEKPGLLTINTYGGSLLVAAQRLGLNIVGSFEDVGFGSDIQAKNFPNVRLVRERRQWPYESLNGTVVIAHPPCAGFSIQAKGTVLKSGKGHGVDSDHFKCTVDVARYSMGMSCAALMIESVQPAMKGGQEVHDFLANEFGYHLFRVLQNAVTFGCPQWRPRFWAVYIRKDLVDRMAFTHTPNVKTVSQVLDALTPDQRGEPDPDHEVFLKGQIQHLNDHGIYDEKFFEEPGMLARNIQKKHGGVLNEISKQYCVGMNAKECVIPQADGRFKVKGYSFVSRGLRVLDPDGFAPVVMGDSWFFYRGRNLTPNEYKALMGFPVEYEMDDDYRKWLSKGVCPPVAEWLLEQVYNALEKKPLPNQVKWCEPGSVVDVQLHKNDCYAEAGVDPPSRKRSDSSPKTREPKTTRRRHHGSSSKKKRVTVTVKLTAVKLWIKDILEEAFKGKESAVHPPLREIVSMDGLIAVVRIQYEPPNSGGSIVDVRRIIARAVARLGAEMGDIQVEELEQLIEDPMNVDEAMDLAKKVKEEPKPDRQPTRKITKNDRRFDQSSLTQKIHGIAVHRDYAAHWFRWGFVGRFIKRHDRVLDAGCGPDLMLARICQKQIKLVPSEMVCVDMNPLEGPAWAWLTLKGEFNFLERHHELGTFDVITSFEVIEHMGMEDGREYLRAMRHCLKADGVLLLSTPVFNGTAAANHIHEYEIEELQKEIEAAEFKVESRFGTFMNYNAMKKVATAQELEVVERIRQYYDDEVTACFLAPLYPDAARNNIWILKAQPFTEPKES